MNKLIFVGGPTAVGKSTLVRYLSKYYNNSITYRRVQAFYDLAKKYNISPEKVFSHISPVEVDDYFVSICKNNLVVISDVHYAVQMNRIDNGTINIYDPYVPTISNDLVKKLQDNNIDIFPIFIECSPKTSILRAEERKKQNSKDNRNISIEDAIIELLSEKKEFIKLAEKCSKYLILNSENKNPKELSEQILKTEQNIKRLKLI